MHFVLAESSQNVKSFLRNINKEFGKGNWELIITPTKNNMPEIQDIINKVCHSGNTIVLIYPINERLGAMIEDAEDWGELDIQIVYAGFPD